MTDSTRRIGILTGGGDCPGLNAVIRAVTKSAILERQWDVLGILDGFEGFVDGRCRKLRYEDVSGILDVGGTILGTSNKANPFEYIRFRDNRKVVTDESARVLANARDWDLHAIVCIGGDGTMAMTAKLSAMGLPVVGVPKTIDNDLLGTDMTFGFQTAVGTVTKAVDMLHSTAEAHHRVMILEVMGRYAGWIALYGGVAGGADVILIPEIPFEMNDVFNELKRRTNIGKRFSIVVAAEGARLKGGSLIVDDHVEDSPDPIRLGGIGRFLKEQFEDRIGLESREVVLGHLQRGGSPCAFDRTLATRMGYHAMELIDAGRLGRMVCLKGWEMDSIPLEQATGGLRMVPLDHHLIKAARAVGTCFGDHR
ncbi:ATP-dependent 6-phosphofructokinase [bacterium]|nr:ATP-dependent 6-phosphofructokinase [candidate division CSSED10-310 bacterium]